MVILYMYKQSTLSKHFSKTKNMTNAKLNAEKIWFKNKLENKLKFTY